MFYEYLQCEDSLRYNVLEASQVKTYYDILSVCMDHLTPEIHDAAEVRNTNTKISIVTLSFCAYLGAYSFF